MEWINKTPMQLVYGHKVQVSQFLDTIWDVYTHTNDF